MSGETTPKSILEAGSRFKGLLVQSKLGKGSTGATYLCSHPILRTPLVVKLLTDGAPSKFDEAHLTARVSSPNVVGVLDAGFEDDTAFLVQQYVDGIDLAELLSFAQAAEITLPIEVVARYLAEAAHGLHALHQAGVVHRDVKPANLFLSASGEVLVGDLGLALDSARPIHPSMVAGTPYFMAPEQWSATKVD